MLASLSIITSSYTKKENPSVIAKALVFPVSGTKSNIGSVWGDERDGGRRTHEGIDIFATRGTPVVAISDGEITFVGNDDIGGKNITLQPDDYEWNAYYAHLDQMFVSPGEHVKKGQMIGTVGNTGNAKSTPAHLHFGIYTYNGAVDPLPYVKTSPKLTSPVPAERSEAKKTTSTKQRTGSTVPKKKSGNKEFETAVKNAAVKVITGELLRRIKI